jgi:NAD-dependent dihydropyrimidine dehydrogenase PreA subunit
MYKIEIDKNKCEGKATCILACPENVLMLSKPTEKLSLRTKLKLTFHGGKQATVINQDDCIGCLACVEACPEDAIQVIPYNED